MISANVSRASAILLAAAGFALLFAPGPVLSTFAPGFPPAAAWLGQLLAAAWLGVATLNWLNRRAILGGIYGRPLVLTNVILYFVGGAATLGTVRRSGGPALLWGLDGVLILMSLVYGVLLLRGPFDRPEK